MGLKIGLYLFCVSMRGHSATMLALAEDHLNDIMRLAHMFLFCSCSIPVLKSWHSTICIRTSRLLVSLPSRVPST